MRTLANRIVEKWHLPQALGFDGSPQEVSLTTGVLNPANNRNSPQGYFALPIACKIPLVGVFVSNLTNAMTAFNVCIGGGAPLTLGLVVPDDSDVRVPPTVNTTQGLCLFQDPVAGGPSDQPISISTAYTGQVFPTSEPDAIFPQGLNLTFRYTSVAGAAGTARVTLMLIPVNIRSSSGVVPFTWANSNVG